ncbi:hypothetical protein Tco_1541676 [Tanacetum coccineum]
MEACFTNLQLLEFLRLNLSTLGEAFFRARITKARFEDERSLDSNEEVKKAHTRVHGLEKQMEKLPIELQLDNNFREALETRRSVGLAFGKQLVDIFALFVVVSVAMLRFQYKEVYKAIFNNNDNVDMLYDGKSWKWPNEWFSKYLVLMLKQDIKLERE